MKIARIVCRIGEGIGKLCSLPCKVLLLIFTCCKTFHIRKSKNGNIKGVAEIDMVYAWPGAEIGMMEADLAAKIMYADASAEELAKKSKEYDELQSSAIAFHVCKSHHRNVKRIAETDKFRRFEMLYTKSVSDSLKKHGTK